MEATIYNQTGKSTGKITLPENVFGAKWNGDLVHQVVVSEQANMRTPIAHVKDRGEVRGGGKKPWNQKGTGQARHGSRRSPIWIGGGITHGPRNDKIYTKKINKKMKAAALYSVLSEKWKKGEILFVDDIKTSAMKTKEAKEILKSISSIEGYSHLVTKRKNAALFAMGAKNKEMEKSFSNIKSIIVDELRNITPVQVLQYKYLVISRPEESIKFMAGKIQKEAAK
jgi:large subunit ribosomal protein L4